VDCGSHTAMPSRASMSTVINPLEHRPATHYPEDDVGEARSGDEAHPTADRPNVRPLATEWLD